MLCSSLSRNRLLILGVVISHVLILLGLLRPPIEEVKQAESGVLLVNIGIERNDSSQRYKNSTTPPVNTLSNKQTYSPDQATNAPSSAGIVGHSADFVGSSARRGVYTPKPHYPLVSRQLKEHGLVIVRLCVNEQGAVEEMDISKSSGFHNLDQSALKALAHWRFSPVASIYPSLLQQCFQTPIQFTLEG